VQLLASAHQLNNNMSRLHKIQYIYVCVCVHKNDGGGLCSPTAVICMRQIPKRIHTLATDTQYVMYINNTRVCSQNHPNRVIVCRVFFFFFYIFSFAASHHTPSFRLGRGGRRHRTTSCLTHVRTSPTVYNDMI